MASAVPWCCAHVSQVWPARNTLLALPCSVRATKTEGTSINGKIAVKLSDSVRETGTLHCCWHLGRQICLSFSSSSWPRICSCPWRSSEGRAACVSGALSWPSRSTWPALPWTGCATEQSDVRRVTTQAGPERNIETKKTTHPSTKYLIDRRGLLEGTLRLDHGSHFLKTFALSTVIISVRLRLLPSCTA